MFLSLNFEWVFLNSCVCVCACKCLLICLGMSLHGVSGDVDMYG